MALRHRPESVIQTATDVAVLAGLVPHARVRVEANLLLGDAALVAGDLRQGLLAYEQALRDAFRLRCADALDGLASVADATDAVAAAASASALVASIRDRCGAVGWRRPDSPPPVAAPAATPPGRRLEDGRRHPGHWWHDGTPAKEGVDELMTMLRSPSPVTAIELLTRSERQIAELVAIGLTNNEIAGRLFISRRTVETHLTHILRKLDLRTRTQLAAMP